MRNLAIGFYTAGTLVGLYLAATRGWELVSLGVFGFVLSLFYAAPPVRLAHRGLGELAVGIGFGPLMVVGSYFVQAQTWSVEALYASLPVAILIATVLYINEIPDRLWDARAGKKTLVVRLSWERAIRGYYLLLAAAYALIAIGALLNLLPLASLVALATIPLAWTAGRVLSKNYRFPYRLIPANAYTILLHLLTGLLLFYAYIADGLL